MSYLELQNFKIYSLILEVKSLQKAVVSSNENVQSTLVKKDEIMKELDSQLQVKGILQDGQWINYCFAKQIYLYFILLHR